MVFSSTAKVKWIYLLNSIKTSVKTLILQEKDKKEQEERKQRIQLYVFVLRSIAYPFNAKQPGDMTKRHQKVTKESLDKLRAKVEVSE